jgi:hypothetical protein
MERPKLTTRMAVTAVVIALALLGGIGLAAAQGGSDDDRRPTLGSTGEDVSGPCDEVEHANDPRCTGTGTGTPTSTPLTTAPTTVPSTTAPSSTVPPTTELAPAPTAPPTTAVAPGVDISGPCDEAEHANDPRCTGGIDGRSDDNSGPGHGGRDNDDDDNSGPGGGGDDHGSGGHGSDD